MSILVCRPENDATKLSEMLNLGGYSSSVLSTLEIKYEKISIDLNAFTDVVFTSKYAVLSFMSQYPASALNNKYIYSIGATTAQHLLQYNIQSEYPDRFNSIELYKIIANNNLVDRNFAIMSGVSGNNFLVDEVSKQNQCSKFECYQRVFVNEETLVNNYMDLYDDVDPDIIVVTSLDVFKSLNRVFAHISPPINAFITITSAKMLKFANDNGFSRTISLDSISNENINLTILEHIEARKNVIK